MKPTVAALLLALGLTGCASIINGRTQQVTFGSTPDNAVLTIIDRAGNVVHSGVTPATVSLMRGYGYFKPGHYTVRFEKPGYSPREVSLAGQVSGWYLGNLIIGGMVLGMLIVDPITGGMFTLAPDKVDAALDAVGAKTSRAGDALTVVLVEDVPAEIMKHARRID